MVPLPACDNDAVREAPERSVGVTTGIRVREAFRVRHNCS